jgi:hypothetical protein
MDPIPFALGSAVAAGLVIAIGHLWHVVTESNKRCEEGRRSDRAEINEMKKMLIDRSNADVVKAEAREERASQREVEIARILDNTKEMTRMVARELRATRKGYTDTPAPGSDDALVAKPDGETSQFFQEPPKRRA